MNNEISVIIPCYPPDLDVLPVMLESLRNQTRLPLEVIVALSETSKEDGLRLDKKYSGYPFSVRFCVTAKKQFAGQNRNRGAAAATNGILVFCDSDDECHPQKIEITWDVFAKYDPKLFLHGFKRNRSGFDLYDKGKIPLITIRQLFDNTFGNPPQRDNSLFIFVDRPATVKWTEGAHPHHGYPAVRRDVFEKVRYCDLRVGEDTKFCLDVLWEFRSAVYADASLVNYHYRYRPETTGKSKKTL